VPVLPPRDNHVQSESKERGGGKRAREDEVDIRSPAPAGPQPLIYEGAPSLPPAPRAAGSARLEAKAAAASPKGCDPICYGFFSSNNSSQPNADTPSTAHEKRTAAAAGPGAPRHQEHEDASGGPGASSAGPAAALPGPATAAYASPHNDAVARGNDQGQLARSDQGCAARAAPGESSSSQGECEPDWGQPVWNDDPVRAGQGADQGGAAFNARYELKGKLGDGGYATVFRGVHRASGAAVAVKQIDFRKWKMYNNGITKEQLAAEFQIHRRLQHPNVVRMMTVFKGAKFIYTVLELVSGGDLFDFLIQKAQHGVAEHVARRWFGHLIEGVDYCHEQQVVHRDLKPENILLTQSSEHAHLKIADFGLSKALNGQNVCRVS
jgi:tRNA A-37 threonylcarbamoyl transferase component Bud32